MRRILYLMFAALGVSRGLSAGGEFVVLANGQRLHAERHEVEGGKIRLFEAGGLTVLPASMVAGFEADLEVTAVAVAAKPVTAAVAAPVSAAEPLPRELAALAARKFALPEAFVQSVMRAESAFRAGVVSPKGAIGLMQLMPATARQLGVDPKNPRQNAEGGARYLHELLKKYENQADQVLLALAAYNAGPAAVEKYHGVPPYRETREYILRVLKNWQIAETFVTTPHP